MTEDPNEEAKGELPRQARPWLDAITDAQKYFQLWQEKSDRIDKLYADLKTLSEESTDREYQMFWANLEILKPSIYARPPAPVVVPRFRTMKDLPRKASELLERTLVLTFEEADINAVMLQIRDDLATNGRGAAWVRLEEVDGRLRNLIEHVDRADFLHEPARKWQEVGWVAKRAWLTRSEGIKRFGDRFIEVELKSRRDLLGDSGHGGYAGEKKAEVWEIWSRRSGVVVWVAPGLEDVLDIREPFLKLETFFPCPRPAYATTERRRLIPVPDFVYYKDQLEEINELTARISALSEGLRMKGFYPAGAGDLAEAVETAVRQNDRNAILVPVSNFAALGGTALRDSIIWLPVAEIAATIKELVFLRRQLIEDVYQITGLSDIMRGATDPAETAAAQELKSQYGSVRIRDRQAELVRIARDITRISAEIIAENYTPDLFAEIAQMDLPREDAVAGEIRVLRLQALQLAETAEPDGPSPEGLADARQKTETRLSSLAATVTLEKAVALLREQRLRPFILEIETDSTIHADENAEKQRRTEFLGALSMAIQQLTPMVAQQPSSASFAIEVLKFAIAPFRAGRSFEGSIDEFAETVRREAEQRLANPGPSPDQMKLQLEEKKLQFDAKKHEAEVAVKQDEVNKLHEREIRKARLEGDALAMAQGEPPAYSMTEIVELLSRQNEQALRSMELIARVLAAPKKVTTPEGRIYLTEPTMVN
ncbi:hypothetical protein [Taklimakanibacter lacteus]|uniref:hypothetical protein n=1 Tax=Taklimakanibacter lacteus TaxID=2268456 RepID=UPI000E67670C